MSTLAVVLDLIRERTTVSRVELAEATGLTQATMTHAVRRLMALGLVHEVGTARSTRGTPRRLLELQPDARHMVGVQFDRYTAVGVVVDLAGRVVAQTAMPGSGDRDPGAVLLDYAARIEALLEDSGVPRDGVLGIGLATHGPQDREAGVLLTEYPAPAWRGYPLAAELAAATGLPVRIENDATAAGLGVQAQGSASSSFAVVYMSGGIGSGVILDGFPYRGVTSNGVELGHISVDAFGEHCGCGNRGCLEIVGGPNAVVRNAEARPGLLERLGLAADQLDAFMLIGRAALAGDPDAAEIIAASAQVLAVGTVSLVNMFDVGRVVLAGRAFADLGTLYRDAIQEVLDRSVFMRQVHSVRVELAPDVSQAPAIGGAAMVLRNYLESSGLRERDAAS
ncbi:ROK family transcriptional regulator [Glycomyces rhizosphaerae]|uniref:ROK family protein n=1 Tax=Glycomyces rhizosphaerae TaxID=2054422 RepID=A0ABV7PZE9_9ACTN